MKVLTFPHGRQVTVRDVANLLGNHYPVHVIDVEHQEELEGWTLEDLVEYFEDEERLLLQHQKEFHSIKEQPTRNGRRRRKAAEEFLSKSTLQRPRVLNQISLEFSKTPLSEKFLSPQFVRDLDWIDHVWPRRRKTDGTLSRDVDEVYPNVQYYCLTSAAGCYTDFHVDFGGTAVWYHVLHGEKDFCLIPPTRENLAIYEDWLCRPDQASVFLPDLIPNPKQNVLRISLQATQTLVIPTAWIHAVYTPSDSLVIGGNFLHGLDISLQLEVHCIEARTRVQEKFRFPHFVPLNFYAGGYYLAKLRTGKISQREVDGLLELVDALDEWWKVQAKGDSQLQSGPTVVSAAEECAKRNQCKSVDDFLAELRKEIKRVITDGISPNPTAPVALPISSSDPAPVSSTNPPNSAPTQQQKIRLSLKGKPGSSITPKIVLSLPSDSTPSLQPLEPTQKVPGEENKFRIVVSSSKWNAAIPPKPKRPREDTEWIDDGATAEEEWVPGGAVAKAKRSSNASQARMNSMGMGRKPKRGATSAQSDTTTTTTTNKQKTPKAPPKPTTTSRQRLMKRFR